MASDREYIDHALHSFRNGYALNDEELSIVFNLYNGAAVFLEELRDERYALVLDHIRSERNRLENYKNNREAS